MAILPAMTEQTNVHRAEARFEALPTVVAAALTAAIVSDSLDSLGVRHQVMTGAIAAVTPGSRVDRPRPDDPVRPDRDRHRRSLR